jgi:hypothetical protein
MRLQLPCEADYRLPTGCVVVRDDLSDPMEQKFFLERYNELYATTHDFEWLRSFIDRKGFMRLLSEFDLLLISEDIPKKDLKEYERSIINFYPVFENSYMMGIADGTVREIPDIRMFYLSFAHTLMELSKKLIQGELLPNDDFSHAEEELSMIIEAAVFFLKKE